MTTVLLATDADWVYDEVEAALGSADTTVFRVRRGRDVIPATHELTPDLVVLDLQIGNMGGIAASMALRQAEEAERIEPVTILMLLDRHADVFMARNAQADGWLLKPLDGFRIRRAATAVLANEPFQEGIPA